MNDVSIQGGESKLVENITDKTAELTVSDSDESDDNADQSSEHEPEDSLEKDTQQPHRSLRVLKPPQEWWKESGFLAHTCAVATVPKY